MKRAVVIAVVVAACIAVGAPARASGQYYVSGYSSGDNGYPGGSQTYSASADESGAFDLSSGVDGPLAVSTRPVYAVIGRTFNQDFPDQAVPLGNYNATVTFAVSKAIAKVNGTGYAEARLGMRLDCWSCSKPVDYRYVDLVSSDPVQAQAPPSTANQTITVTIPITKTNPDYYETHPYISVVVSAETDATTGRRPKNVDYQWTPGCCDSYVQYGTATASISGTVTSISITPAG